MKTTIQNPFQFWIFSQNLLIKISITENYKPFSVGLFDFKNAIYLFSIGIMFLIISSVNIQKKKMKNFSTNKILTTLSVITIVIIINCIANFFPNSRIDCTKEKIYIIK